MIRPARPRDAARAALVLRASIRDLCRADHHDDPEALANWLANKTPEAVAALIADPGGRVMVAEDGEVVAVGAMEWAGHAPDEGKITLLYVDPGARGQGWSSALLAAMETELAAMGRINGLLTATATAADFYRRRGWRDDGPPRAGRWIVGQPMTKTLARSPA